MDEMQIDSDNVDGDTSGTVLHGAIEALRSASRTPARQRQANVAQIVDDVCSLAATHGLDEAAFNAIVDIVTSRCELDQASTTALVKHMFPAGPVSAEATAVIVGSLGQGASKPSPGTQTELVKWLVNAREVVDATALSRLYGVLFALLDTLNLRNNLCHLLSLITRRRHVRPFRIQQLLELSRISGPEPAVLALLRVYKDYYPDIIVESSTSRATLPRLNTEWRQDLFAIQEANENAHLAASTRQSGFKVLRRNRAKPSVIPEVHTIQAKEKSVTLEEIDTVNDFVGHLERIELPSQLIAILTDPLLQKYLTLKPSSEATSRIKYWLDSFIQVEAQDSGVEAGSVRFLEDVLVFLRSCKPCPVDLDEFIESAFQLWRSGPGKIYLGFLSHISIRSFQGFRTKYLDIARVKLLNTLHEPHLLLEFFTELTQNWAARLLTSPILKSSSSPDLLALQDLIAHVNAYMLELVVSERQILTLVPSMFMYWTSLESINASSAGRLPLFTIAPQLINFFEHAPSLASLSRLCALLASHKGVLEGRSLNAGSTIYPASESHVRMFNMHITDTCNIIWRSRGLIPNPDAPLISGGGCPPATRQALQNYLAGVDKLHSVAVAFDLSHHPTLSFVTPMVMRVLEDEYFTQNGIPLNHTSRHTGPVTQMSLSGLSEEGGAVVYWKEFRVAVLDWLAERGADGVKRLMFGTMKDLMRPA